ncbi:MAG: cupin domain-containing protein [Nitrosomonadales bacterium]
MKKSPSLLGGLSTTAFLRDYWQKKPLLIRQALPQFKGLVDRQQLITLACDQDAQARVVTQRRGAWQLHHAPFEPEDFNRFGKTKWTVLLQGLNHHLASGAELLKHFDFIPHARLDDLMVSYAPKGGGVGPHFDSYDVFLLQGMGHRRWQISTQADRMLIENAPLRILKDFRVEQEWVLAPGDMLYLPPHCAHNGIAEDDCMTYSIGFRTPTYQELAEQFLVHLQDRLCVDGMYADPDLRTQRHPSEIGADMLNQVEQAIRQIQWGKLDIAEFLGCYLSEPKPHIFFDPPGKPLSRTRLQQVLQTRGVELDLKAQMLCHGSTIFINGEAHTVSKNIYHALRPLADSRELYPTPELPQQAYDLLYRWYLEGYIVPVKGKFAPT